jgi:integrase
MNGVDEARASSAQPVVVELPDVKHARRRFRWTSELDAALLELFEARPDGLDRAFDKIRKLHPDWPSYVFSKRARRLGLYRRRPHRKKKWTPVQVEYLRENVGAQHDKKIAERVGHSRKAVRDKIRSEGLGSARLTEGYSIRQACRDLNVSHHTVRRFIANEWLTTQGGRITEESYRRFCRNHTDELNWESLTDAEVERVFRAIDESEPEIRKRNRAVVCLLVEAGLRVSEITALQMSDIRLHRAGAIRVFGGKSEPPREIPISKPLFAALREHVASIPERWRSQPLFTKDSRQPLRSSSISEVIAALSRKAKIVRIRLTPTILRHTFAERYLRLRRGNVIKLHDVLGNASLQTTFIYARRCEMEVPAETFRTRERDDFDDTVIDIFGN